MKTEDSESGTVKCETCMPIIFLMMLFYQHTGI